MAKKVNNKRYQETMKLAQSRPKEEKNERDKIYTPSALAKVLISMVPLKGGDTVLDPCKGKGSFFDNYPSNVFSNWCEVDQGRDFLEFQGKVDWIITNPPYSRLKEFWTKTLEVCEKGFAFLLGSPNITPQRIESAKKSGFTCIRIHLTKVDQWFGYQFFLIFAKNNEAELLSFDRTIWV